VKEASDNFTQIADLLDGRPDNFSVLTGEDTLILPFMAMGGDGVISVAANQVPAAVKQLVDSVAEGNLEEARRISKTYRNLFRLNFIESNPVPIKCALAMMGMIKEVYRLPLTPVSEESRRLLSEEMLSLGLI